MSTTSPIPVQVPTPAGELHGLPLVAHIEALLALAPDPTPEVG
jgi:hypothetical protein